jgi:hypothetical protein
VALATAVLLLRRGSTSAEVKIVLRPEPPAVVSVVLVDGAELTEREYAPGGVTFSLAPGRYEVFVGDRYTGRILDVPGQQEPLVVPLPSAPTTPPEGG